GHERCRLLVADRDEADGRSRQRVVDVQRLLARHAEHVAHAFPLETTDEQLGACHMGGLEGPLVIPGGLEGPPGPPGVARGAPAEPWRPSMVGRDAPRCWAWSGDPDGLDVDELADAVLRELAAVARALDPTERQPRVGLDQAVDEHRARLDLRGQPFGAGAILRPQRSTQTERRVVGQPDGVGLVARTD